MKDILILCLSGLLGTLGFALLFRIRLSRLPFAALGGLLACAAYVAGLKLSGDDLFLSNLLASAVATAYCELFARIIKVPVTVLLLPSVIPLVPGGPLYYSMSYLIRWDREQFLSYGLITARTGFGIAVGLMSVSLLAHLLTERRKPIWNRAA